MEKNDFWKQQKTKLKKRYIILVWVPKKLENWKKDNENLPKNPKMRTIESRKMKKAKRKIFSWTIIIIIIKFELNWKKTDIKHYTNTGYNGLYHHHHHQMYVMYDSSFAIDSITLHFKEKKFFFTKTKIDGGGGMHKRILSLSLWLCVSFTLCNNGTHIICFILFQWLPTISTKKRKRKNRNPFLFCFGYDIHHHQQLNIIICLSVCLCVFDAFFVLHHWKTL